MFGGDGGEHLDPDWGRRLAVLAHALRIIQGQQRELASTLVLDLR